MAWQLDDNTYNDIREKSLYQWLDEIQEHEDIVVRGGVRLAKEYIEYLKQENNKLKDEIKLRNDYLKKIKNKKVD